MMKQLRLSAVVLLATASIAHAAPINTNDGTIYGTFATGATIQTFEAVSGLTPLALTSYANTTNGTIAVPTTAQLGGQITGLHFHSGGGSFNNPITTPGTPTALLSLQGALANDDRPGGTNAVGALEINTENLDLNAFIEIIFSDLQERVGVWLNPSLGNVTFSAFDSTGNQLESFTGTAGNFVGVDRTANDVKFISIVAASAAGFTADDLTYGQLATGGGGGGGGGGSVPEPGTLALAGLALAGLFVKRRKK